VKPRFEAYTQVSQQIRAIFADYTDAIEPLSLDEAYLDVSGVESARDVAEAIRQRIKAETGLTASAGVSYNKFIAKLASDQNKPDGLCVIPPRRGPAFVASLPVRRFHGIGPVTAARMEKLGIHTGADLRAQDRDFLVRHFGSSGDYFFGAARGIDERPVRSQRPLKSVGAETTFGTDLTEIGAVHGAAEGILDSLMRRLESAGVAGRTITLKVRYADFRQMTRSKTLSHAISDGETIARIAGELIEQIPEVSRGIRLLGVTLSSIETGEERLEQRVLAL